MDSLDAWNNRLVREYPDRELPGWAKDAVSKGLPKSIVKAAFLKRDRELGAGVAYS